MKSAELVKSLRAQQGLLGLQQGLRFSDDDQWFIMVHLFRGIIFRFGNIWQPKKIELLKSH